MKNRRRLVFGILISLVFLYLAMRNIRWSELWQSFREADYLYLIPALLILVLINWVRAYRWRLLMYPDTHLPLGKVFWLVNIGYLFNNILPAKAGEVIRGYLVGRELSGGLGQALSTLLIERLLDVLTLVVLLVVLIPFVELPVWAMQGGLLFGGAAIAGTLVLLVLSRYGDKGVEWALRLMRRIPLVGHPKIESGLRNLIGGFGVLWKGHLLPGIVVGSGLIWLGYALFNYTLMAVFNLTHLPFSAAALVLCATGFSMVVPSSPGAMGVFEWAAVLALAVYSIGESPAFGYALGLHTFTNVALIIFGLVGMMREGLSYAHVRSGAMGGESPSAGTIES
jgi:uncharacterized protein (TIRG00374 family)